MAICKYSINSYISLNKNKKDTESSEFAERLSKISTAMEPNEIKIKALDALIKTTLSRTQTSLKDSSFKVILLLALFENPDTKKHFFNDDIAFANDLESDVRKYFFLIEHLKENIRSIFDPPKGTFSSITDLFRNRTESTLAPTSSLVLTPSGEDLHLEFTGFSWEEINKIIRIFDDAIERYRLGNPNKSPTDKGIINVANFETTLNKIYNANSSMQDKKSALEDLVKTALAVPQITLSDKSFKVILLLKLFSNPGTKAYFFNSTGEPPQFKSGIEKFSFLITQLKEEFQNESIQASSNRFSSFRKSLSIKISDTPAPASLGKSFDKKYSAAEFVSALLSVLQSIAGPIDIDPTRTLEHTFSSLNESDGFSTSVKTAEKLPTLLKKQEFLVDTIKTVLTDSDNSSKEKLLPLLFQNEMTKEFFFTDLRTLASRISSIPTSSPDKTATALGVYLDYLKPQFKPAAPLSEGNNPEFLMSS
jgi:glutaredoxin 2